MNTQVSQPNTTSNNAIQHSAPTRADSDNHASIPTHSPENGQSAETQAKITEGHFHVHRVLSRIAGLPETVPPKHIGRSITPKKAQSSLIPDPESARSLYSDPKLNSVCKRNRKRHNAKPSATKAIKTFCEPYSTMRTPNEDFKNHHISPNVPISQWLIDILPPTERSTCLTAALVLGIMRHGRCVQEPQFRIHTVPGKNSFIFHPNLAPDLYERLWQFAKEAGIQKYTVLIRTAIMAGFNFPDWEHGDHTPLRLEPLTMHEYTYLLTAANVRPKRPELILTSVYDEIERKPELLANFPIITKPEVELYPTASGQQREVKYG